MPFHPEVIAAHMLPYFADRTETALGQGGALLALAESDGDFGPATAALLAYGLGNSRRAEQTGAVDALLALAGRGRLPAAFLGAALATLTELQCVKLNRITKTLGEAAQAGAHTEVWTALAAALPGLLPDPGSRPPAGLADLLALATRTLEASTRTPAGTGANQPAAGAAVPELAAFVDRGRASRVAREAARLQDILSHQ